MGWFRGMSAGCVGGAIVVLVSVGSAAAWGGGADQAGKASPRQEAQKYPFTVEGQYVEACTCRPPCPCELVGANHGCKGVGVWVFDRATYKGVDLSGVKIAYATGLEKWVDMYVDAQSPEQREAAAALGRAILRPFGPVDAVKDAKIDVVRDGYAYTVTVDGGQVMKFQTEPVLGGDKKTPVTHGNIADPLNSTFLQGRGVAVQYNGPGDKAFTIERGRNSYFNDRMKASGEL